MTSSLPEGELAPLSPTQQKVRWQAYWVAVGVASLTILDLAKINVAIPAISESLGAGPTEVQLLPLSLLLYTPMPA